MTQIASLLAVATIFIGLYYSQGGGLIHVHKTKLSMQDLELNMWGLMCEGGCNHGILRY